MPTTTAPARTSTSSSSGGRGLGASPLLLAACLLAWPDGASACRFELREQSRLTLPAPLEGTRIAVADVDDDGFDDLVVTNPDCPGSIHVVRSDGAGLVLHQVLDAADGLDASPGGVDVADLDDDGDQDIVVGHLVTTPCGARGVTVFPQRADGTFGEATIFTGDNDGRVVLATDFGMSAPPSIVTGDGPEGLNPTTGKAIQVRENEGPGDFSHVHEYGVQSSTRARTSLLATGSLDGDGVPDVLVLWSLIRQVGTLCNFGDDTFETWNTTTLGGPAGVVSGQAAGDADLDGRLDLLLAFGDTPTLALFRSASTTACGLPAIPEPCTTVGGIEDVVLADLDADGHLDIAGTVPDRGTLAMHGGTGEGSFSPARELDVGGEPLLIASGRFLRRSRPDLVVLDADGELRLLRNDAAADRCPVARAPSVLAREAGDGCEAVIALNATGSFDLDDDPLTYTWSEGGVVLEESGDPVVERAFPRGTHDLVLVVSDPAGNESRPVAVQVRVVDRTPPDVTAEDPEPAECTSPEGAIVTLSASATDECGEPTLSSSLGSENPVSATFPVGTRPVDWVARDPGGNTAVERVEVVVRDTTPPELSCPSTVVESCAGRGGAPVDVRASAGDACSRSGEIAIVNDRGCGGADASGTYPGGETTVTFSAVDPAGNEATCTTRVVVVDDVPPVIDAPERVRIECTDRAAFVSLRGHATDACSSAALTNDRTGTADASGSYPLGTTTVTWEALDEAGNVATATTVVEVVDTEGPELSCPEEAEAECTGPSGAVVALHATALDACAGGFVTNSHTRGGPDATSRYPVGVTAVHFTTEDLTGIHARCTSLVRVQDTSPPELRCPAEVRAECAGAAGARVAVLAEVTDCCDEAPGVVNDRTAGGADATDVYPVGVSAVRFDAVDAAGLTATCTTRVVVEDTLPPALSCPARVEAECTGGGTARVALQAFAADACDPAPAVVNDRTGGGADATDEYPLGTTRVAFSAADAAGHAATCVSEVVVRDTLPPVALVESEAACLWPPNHRFVRLRLGEELRVAAADLCAEPGDLTVTVLDVVSNEPVDGRGDGATAPDVVVRDDELFLRSERRGGAPGRIYSVRIGVSDPAGNVTEAEVEVRVPHGGRAPEGCKALPPERFLRDAEVLP